MVNSVLLVDQYMTHFLKMVQVLSHAVAGAAEHIFHKGGPTYMQSCNYVAIAYKITQFSV